MATVREGVFRLPVPMSARTGDIVELYLERAPAGQGDGHAGRNGKPTAAGGPTVLDDLDFAVRGRLARSARRSRSTSRARA